MNPKGKEVGSDDGSSSVDRRSIDRALEVWGYKERSIRRRAWVRNQWQVEEAVREKERWGEPHRAQAALLQTLEISQKKWWTATEMAKMLGRRLARRCKELGVLMVKTGINQKKCLAATERSGRWSLGQELVEVLRKEAVLMKDWEVTERHEAESKGNCWGRLLVLPEVGWWHRQVEGLCGKGLVADMEHRVWW